MHSRLLSYCFARPTHTYLDFNAREDFEREIVVKVNVPELVRAELARPSWKGEHVALGTNTDPYQWVEGRYKLMRGIWEAMRDFANPCSVLTKSPLLLRDLDLMKEISERTDFTANLSIPTLDEKAWRDTEPHTPHPRKRIEAVAELKRAGIRTGVLIAPLIPGVNDAPRPGRAATGAARRGGAGLDRRGRRSTCAARCATSGSTGCASGGPICCPATRSCTSAAPTCERTRRAGSRRWSVAPAAPVRGVASSGRPRARRATSGPASPRASRACSEAQPAAGAGEACVLLRVPTTAIAARANAEPSQKAAE